MSIIVPHIPKEPQRHSTVPYLWRAGCSCGWWALAGNRNNAVAATNHHLDEEEPFPSHLLFDKEIKNEKS